MEESSDLSKMKIMAWTDDSSRIPRRKKLLITEHERQIVYDDPDMQRIFTIFCPTCARRRFYPMKSSFT